MDEHKNKAGSQCFRKFRFMEGDTFTIDAAKASIGIPKTQKNSRGGYHDNVLTGVSIKHIIAPANMHTMNNSRDGFRSCRHSD
ncbi:hypothetical protein ACNKHM_24975 [Shigella sonnei]